MAERTMKQHDALSVSLDDLVNCLADTIDLVSPALAGHHNRVGLIASALAHQTGLSEEAQLELLFAGKLHDIGALSLTDRIRLLQFDGGETRQHAEIGALLLGMFQPLDYLAEMIRFHHVDWAGGVGKTQFGSKVPLGSHILHLADRIAVLLGEGDGLQLLARVPDIIKKVQGASGEMFSPELVEAFIELSSKEFFWFDLAVSGRKPPFHQSAQCKMVALDTEGILGLSRMFAGIIDFRSRFTATHSSGVAASAEALARFSGRSVTECTQMRIAGLLHDLGKLAIPAELLEKPTGLTSGERKLICCHTYFTRRALNNINSFELITDWSANHHERIDGKGYPYHFGGSDLSLGSRIMAVSDVFTALTEDRPYRPGMDRSSVQGVLKGMVGEKALDPDLVTMLLDNYDEINVSRVAAQSEAVAEYGKIFCQLSKLTQ